MLVVYRSNSLELFIKLIINIISSDSISDPMKSEVILVDHKIVEQYIEIKLTKYFGVTANINFMNIVSFIHQIFVNILNPTFNIQHFSKDFIFWKFMGFLPELCIHKNCAVIQQYLYHDLYQQKLGQLSEQLSNLFAEYLIYRSDWLDYWSVKKTIDNIDVENQLWQSEIWNSFLKSIDHSYQKLKSWNHCINLIQKNIKIIDYDKLPKRIFIYVGMSIPPIYWKILNLLSYRINIYIWFISPYINNLKYSHNKPNVNNSFFNSVNQYNNNKDDVFFKNPLLQKWGRISKDNLYLTCKLENLSIVQKFVVPKSDSMLHILQKDILENQLDFKQISYKNRSILNPSDDSITIHVCHNIRREIEILHDNLLLILSNNQNLSPGDIMVMAPNINDYESNIQNVFNNIFHRKLPFTISKDLEQYMHPIILALFQILMIPRSRFTIEEVLSLLSISGIASKFDINCQEIQLLKKMVIESGVRWGLDAKTMQTFNIPMIYQNTWFFGLKRMLLGYAINSKEDNLWENIFPYDYTNEDNIYLVSKLGNFLNILKKWRYILGKSYTLTRWIFYIQDIINDFFDYNSLNTEEKENLFVFKSYWIDIIQSGIKAEYSNNINIIILIDKLKERLSKKKIKYYFLPNAINFCNIVPICYIPCKVLCIIGMNNDVFPRRTLLSSFNLILKEKHIGDSSIYEKDLHSFLLACLLPTKKIYISFIKQSNSSNNIRPKSRLIDELLEYIAQKFYLIQNLDLNIDDNLICLRKHIFKQYSYLIFDTNNFDKKVKSFAEEWVPAIKTSFDSTNVSIYIANLMTKLPNFSINTISFNELYKFYQHPIRTWFQKRLSVYFPVYSQQSLNNEPFFLNSINRFNLDTKIIDYILHKKDVEKLYYEFYSSGILPYGQFGKLLWVKEYERMIQLAKKIQPFYVLNQIHRLNISLQFNKIRLFGQLSMVQNHGLVRWKPAYLSMKDYFLLWLEHITYCAVGGKGDSQLFGIDNIWCFPNLIPSTAKKILYSLISGYCAGINMPLMLLYQSGGMWMHSIFNWKNKKICSTYLCQEKARLKLIQAWEGNNQNNSKYYFSIGENQDPYLRKLLPTHLSEENIQNIMDIAKYYFLDVMKYRVL